MQSNQKMNRDHCPAILPWLLGMGAFLIYLFTLNKWVSTISLPFVAKITGWDPALPYQLPLFFTLTYPIRFLPHGWQPVALNVFSALCGSITLGLLARSVILLPHDRTHEQRQRERSEFSLLTIRAAWLPPILAVFACGLQLTMWEHSTAATTESLGLLIFAYVIRCLLEYRIDHRESWIQRMAFVYGLGVADNWALIGFFPFFLLALIWIKGMGFFKFRFIVRTAGAGLLGLLLYLLLPIVWMIKEPASGFSFIQLLRINLANQKLFLWDTPILRSRAFLLALTSILPVFIIGIRWPSSFGETSAAGATLTNFMFRVVHLVFLIACAAVTFDERFSPRTLGMGLPFLTFYYLGALCIGYFSGYLLLVFGTAPRKSWHKPSAAQQLAGAIAQMIVWICLIVVPIGLVYRNLPVMRAANGTMLREFLALTKKDIPANGAVLLSDDSNHLLLLKASEEGTSNGNLLVHSRSLAFPSYHRQLRQTYGSRWPLIPGAEMNGVELPPSELQTLILNLSHSNAVFYLHPSFGYFFEAVYQQPLGAVYPLREFPENDVFPPELSQAQINQNQEFWSKTEDFLRRVEKVASKEVTDARYIANYYSRSLNDWGVELQRKDQLAEAGKFFQRAADLNSNNIPALVNLEFNKSLVSKRPRSPEILKTIEDKFGKFRSWEAVLEENGPFDEPEYSFRLGQLFLKQSLVRQAAMQLRRAKSLDPDNMAIRLALGNAFLSARLPELASGVAADVRKHFSEQSLSGTNQFNLVAFEAAIEFSKTNFPGAERLLVDLHAKYPNEQGPLESLTELYRSARKTPQVLETLDERLKLAPDQPGLLLEKASALIGAKQFPEADALLDRLLKMAPQNVQALVYRIFIAIQRKDYKQALAQTKLALSLDPLNLQAINYEAVIGMETKDYEQALKSLDKALKMDPANIAALRNRAIVNLQAGHLKDARKDYELLRDVFPNLYSVYYGLGEVAYRLKETDLAIKNYEMYLKYAPANPSPEQAEERKQIDDKLKELKTARR